MVTTATSAAPALSPEPDMTLPKAKRFIIAYDTVRAATEDLPDEQQEKVRWFYQFCRRSNFSKTELEGVLKQPGSSKFYSSDSIVQLLTGGRMRRGENIAPMLEAIDALRRVESLREGLVNSGYIRTRLYFEIEKRLQKALKRQRFTFFWGDSQIGKSAAFEEYQKHHNHGETILIEVPAGGSVTNFLRELANHFNLPTHLNQGLLAQRLIEAFDSRMLLIVDEAHRCLKTRHTSSQLGVFDFLRELWNRKRCGIAIAMTNEGRDLFLHGPHAKALEQTWRRRITPLQLPAITPTDDLALFAKAYGLPPATDEPLTIKVTFQDEAGTTREKRHTDTPLNVQTTVNATEGLGVWISILQDASDIAAEQKRPIAWGAVLKAHCQAQADAEMLD